MASPPEKVANNRAFLPSSNLKQAHFETWSTVGFDLAAKELAQGNPKAMRFRYESAVDYSL